MRNLSTTLFLLLLPLLGSCVAVAAGAAAGVIISKEVLAEEVHSATLAADVDDVWATAQETLRSLSTKPIVVTQSPRVATGVVEGADVTVEVLAYDLEITQLKVRAVRLVAPRPLVARRVRDTIIDRVAR